MKNKCILDCMTLVGHTPSKFEGSKTYVSTGAVDCDHIAFEDTEQVTYIDRPSRANLAAEVGDILFAKMASTEKTLRITRENADYLYSTGFYAVRANDDVLLPECLYHLLSSEQFLLQKDRNSSGATQKAITNAGLAKIMVSIPPMEEQEKLAKKLDTIMRLIALRREELVELDNVVKSRFIELFGDPVKNDKGFEVRKGVDCFKLSNGKFVPESKRFSSGIPAYGGNGISWYTDDIIFEGDTIVVGRVGFQSGNVHLAKGPLWITDNAMYISRFSGRPYDLVLLTALMEHIDFTRYQDAGDLKKITQKPFMEMDFIYPPIALQEQYTAFVEQTDKSKLYSEMEVAA